MKLPQQFTDHMQALGPPDEQERFFASFDEGKYSGVRANRLKIAPEDLPGLLADYADVTGNIPWCGDGFYYENGQPGRNGLYHAGV